MNENENENSFKHLTIALNDHGGYKNPSQKIFDKINTSGCISIEENKVKTFLGSDDLFFVYSVPHNCKHMETKEPSHVFTKILNPHAQRLASCMYKDANIRALKDENIENLIV